MASAAALRPASAQGDALQPPNPNDALESTSARSLGDLAAAGPGPLAGLVRRGPKRSPISNLFGAPTTGDGGQFVAAAPPSIQRDSSEAVLVEPADPLPEPDSLASTPLVASERSPDSNINYGMSSVPSVYIT